MEMRIALQKPIRRDWAGSALSAGDGMARVTLLQGRGKPVTRRKRDAPDIAGHFQLDANLKQFANRFVGAESTARAGTVRGRGLVPLWGHFKGEHIFFST